MPITKERFSIVLTEANDILDELHRIKAVARQNIGVAPDQMALTLLAIARDATPDSRAIYHETKVMKSNFNANERQRQAQARRREAKAAIKEEFLQDAPRPIKGLRKPKAPMAAPETAPDLTPDEDTISMDDLAILNEKPLEFG